MQSYREYVWDRRGVSIVTGRIQPAWILRATGTVLLPINATPLQAKLVVIRLRGGATVVLAT